MSADAEVLLIVLAPETIEAIARRVAELLAAGVPTTSGGLVDAQTVARELGVARDWVYEHAAELGAVRVGNGSRPRLRFDLEHARGALACGVSRGSQSASNGTVEPKASRRGITPLGTRAELLPIRPRKRPPK